MSFTSTWGLHGGLTPGALARGDGYRANGLMVRGVVTASYTVEEPESQTTGRSAVFCDVYVYSTLNRARYSMLSRVLVSQDRGAVHDGSTWKPRASTMNLANAAVGTDLRGMNPADLDGEHVLIGFMDDDLRQPVILRGIPHPRADFGKDVTLEDRYSRVAPLAEDGYTRFTRHNGTTYGVDGLGNFVVSAVRANAGPAADGKEPGVDPDALIGGLGNISFEAATGSTITLIVRGMTDELSMRVTITDGMISAEGPGGVVMRVRGDGLFIGVGEDDMLSMYGVGTEAVMTVGDGGRTDPNAAGDPLGLHVPIVERLEALYTSLKAAFDAHTHAIAPGAVAGTTPVTGSVLAPGSAAPAWDAAINSTKVRIPG